MDAGMPGVTCALAGMLQADADGLVSEQRGGGQGARHALHDADVLHALRDGERGNAVVSLEGTVAVYTATCRVGGHTAGALVTPVWHREKGRVLNTP